MGRALLFSCGSPAEDTHMTRRSWIALILSAAFPSVVFAQQPPAQDKQDAVKAAYTK
jgi:hypothetical protein